MKYEQISIFDIMQEKEEERQKNKPTEIDKNIYELLDRFFTVFNLNNSMFKLNEWQNISDIFFTYSVKLDKIARCYFWAINN